MLPSKNSFQHHEQLGHGQAEEKVQDSDKQGPILQLQQDASHHCLLAEVLWDPVSRSTGVVQVRHQAEGGLQAAGQ